ncbi:hypothetical protein Tco_0912530 [Tanacetum coccineum]
MYTRTSTSCFDSKSIHVTSSPDSPGKTRDQAIKLGKHKRTYGSRQTIKRRAKENFLAEVSKPARVASNKRLKGINQAYTLVVKSGGQGVTPLVRVPSRLTILVLVRISDSIVLVKDQLHSKVTAGCSRPGTL